MQEFEVVTGFFVEWAECYENHWGIDVVVEFEARGAVVLDLHVPSCSRGRNVEVHEAFQENGYECRPFRELGHEVVPALAALETFF